MTAQMNMTTERVDDIPLLLAHSDKMGVPELLDTYFKPHGNWEGMSLGWTTAIWLTHILSEGDHRMNQVQGWARQRVETLRVCTGQEIRDQEWSNGRLALVLDALAISTPATVLACAVFFWSRLAYVVIYTLGVPVLRTLAFTVGFLAEAALVLAIFRMI